MKFKKLNWYLLIPFLLVAGVCSGESEKAEPRAYLATHTDENGHRLFHYSLDFQTSEKDKGGTWDISQPGNVRGHVRGSSSRGVSGGVTFGAPKHKQLVADPISQFRLLSFHHGFYIRQ
jgi:hypothetical protein